jgi:hypothetical protein
MIALAAGFVALVRRPTEGVIRGVRILAGIGLIISVAGVGFHVVENLTAGPLDGVYAATWGTLPPLEQWWTAITGGVGPAPTLAPGALAEIALTLLLATLWRGGAIPIDQ